MKRWLLPVLALAAIPAIIILSSGAGPRSAAAAAPQDSFDEKEFKNSMASYDHDVRQKAIDTLDPNDEKQFDLLLKKGLKDRDWYVRVAAQFKIAKVSDEGILAEAVDLLKKHKDFPIREGIAAGLGLRKDPALIPNLVEALEDKSVHVRETAARALSRIPEKDCIEPLIKAIENEDEEYRVFIVARKGLEKLTGRYLGDSPADWRNWWEGNKERFEMGEEVDEAELKKAEEAGHKIKDEKKTVAGVRLDFKVKGLGAPMIVLPEFGYSGGYMNEFIEPLSASSQIFFCDLPPVSSFENLERGQGNFVVYPTDKLCEAFAEFVKQTKNKKIGILADQRSCWVAMRFATLYPQNVRYMILMSPTSGSQAALKATQRMEAHGKKIGNPDIEHHAQSHILSGGNPVYRAKDAEEQAKFEPRMHFTEWWYRQFDSTIAELIVGITIPQGEPVVFSGFEIGKEKPVAAPVLIVWGQRTPAFNKGDVSSIGKFYKNSQTVLFDKSAQMPFVEEHEKFIGIVEKFLKKAR